MKETGIMRRIDDLGRVVIPRDIRRQLGIVEGDAFEICFDEHGVYFKKYDLGDRILHAVDALDDVVRDQDYSSAYYQQLVPIVNELRKTIREIKK